MLSFSGKHLRHVEFIQKDCLEYPFMLDWPLHQLRLYRLENVYWRGMEREIKENQNGLVDFLASLRVTLFLLVLLGFICALGTLVPLTSDYSDFRRFLIGGVGRLMLAWGFDKPFTSTSFRVVLGLLALNLCFCTLRRLPPLLAAYFVPTADKKEPFFDNGDFRARGGKVPTDGFEAELSKHGYSVVASNDGEGSADSEGAKAKGKCLLARRGALAPFGPQVTHLGVLLLFLGGVLGWYGGYEGYAEASAGTTFNVHQGEFYRIVEQMRRISFLRSFYLDLEKERVLKEKDVLTFRTLESEFNLLEKKRQELAKSPLFQVRVLEAREEHYSGNRGVKDWTSVLQVEVEGKKQVTQAIEVNVPLEYGSVTMYQHSFDRRPVNSSGPGALVTSTVVSVGEAKELASVPLTLEVKEFYADFAVAPSQSGAPKAFSKSDELNNPAVKVLVNEKRELFLFEKPPHVIHEDPESRYKVRLLKVTGPPKARKMVLAVYEPKFEAWTGISIQHDPGTWLVWFGSFLMMIGMALSFYCEHRRIWIYVTADGEVKIAGLAAKFPASFREEFTAITEAFQAQSTERSSQ